MIILNHKGKKVREFDTKNIEIVIDKMQEEAYKSNSLIFHNRSLWRVVGDKLIHETILSYSEFEIVGEFVSIQKEYPKE